MMQQSVRKEEQVKQQSEQQKTGYQKTQKLKHHKEILWRLMEPEHVTMHSFRQHQRLEAYYEQKEYGNIFQCDRLLKLETVFGRIQMGYNPNKRRGFLFVHMKNNLYDTISSQEQKSMKEYQQKRILREEDNHHAYVSKRRKHTAVLLEKEEYKPWSMEVTAPYLKHKDMEALQKTMPFLDVKQERNERSGIRQEIRQLQEEVRENSIRGAFQENTVLHQQIRILEQESELLQSICYRKERGQRGFFRKLNYAFDIEKHAMFDYYREQRKKAEREQVSHIPEDEDRNDTGQKQNEGSKPNGR